MAATTESKHGAAMAKIAALVTAQKDLLDKALAIQEEIAELLSGGPGIADRLKQLEKAFDEAWGRRYAGGAIGRYVWRYAVDRPNAKRIIRQLGLEECMARAVRYIATDDEFLARQRHPFGLFVSGINSYAAQGTAPELELEDSAPAIDCRHKPPCRSDAEHTRKRQRELRG